MDIRKLKDKALEFSAKRRFDKAAEVYAEICGLEPRDLQLRQRWGDSLRSAGKGSEAVGIYRAVADAYAKDGQLLKAIAVNKLLLELDPGHTETQRRLADLYARRAPSSGSQSGLGRRDGSSIRSPSRPRQRPKRRPKPNGSPRPRRSTGLRHTAPTGGLRPRARSWGRRMTMGKRRPFLSLPTR